MVKSGKKVGPPTELGGKLFFGDTRDLVGQVDEGIELFRPSSRSKQKFPGLLAYIEPSGNDKEIPKKDPCS